MKDNKLKSTNVQDEQNLLGTKMEKSIVFSYGCKLDGVVTQLIECWTTVSKGYKLDGLVTQLIERWTTVSKVVSWMVL